MKPPDRPLHRLAAMVLACVKSAGGRSVDRLQSHIGDLQYACKQIEPLQRQLGICQERHWPIGTQAIQNRIGCVITEVSEHAAAIAATCRVSEQAFHAADTGPTLRDVLGELRQIEEEFDGFSYDMKARLVSVETEPIELEDIPLGRFKIELDLRRIPHGASSVCYSVVALDPNPASSNSAVTHPHVRDEHLCEGDATIGIKHALESGRLFDFFVLVRSVLQNYNSESPFVSLSNWDGVSCHDCGYAEGETSYCECCSNDFCEECISYCNGCDTTMCRSCLETCCACDQRMCSDCIKICDACSRTVCIDCLENDLCPDCREKAEKEHEQREREHRERTAEQREHDQWDESRQLHERQLGDAQAAVAGADAVVQSAAA